MNPVIETQAVIVRESSAVGQALGVNEIIAQVRLIQEVMAKVMQEGQHFGCIPGTGDKKTLLQPGAQKLTMTFRLAPEYELQETNLAREHKEYRVICTLKSIQTGNFVGQGVGCCSTMESKYRYRGGARKCPNCSKETIIKGKAEYGGGWLCFAKKGGCGAKWEDGAPEIESQSVERVECDNPADFYNTVLKMAKKRAFVDATITATAASDIFTQDIGDDESDGNGAETSGKAVSSQVKPKTAPSPPPSVKAPPVASQTKRTPAEEKEHLALLEAWLERCKIDLVAKLEPVAGGAKEYAQKSGLILSNELFQDISFVKLFPSLNWDKTPEQNKAAVAADFHQLTAAIQRFMDGASIGEEDDIPFGDTTAKADAEWFFSIIVPVPHKNQRRDDYLKNPDTIKSLFDARHDDEEARRRLFGFLYSYEPKAWEKKDGTKMPPSESDLTFRKALDAFGEWFERTHPEENKQD